MYAVEGSRRSRATPVLDRRLQPPMLSRTDVPQERGREADQRSLQEGADLRPTVQRLAELRETINGRTTSRVFAEPVVQRKIGALGDGQYVINRNTNAIYLARFNATENAYDLYSDRKFVGRADPEDEDYDILKDYEPEKESSSLNNFNLEMSDIELEKEEEKKSELLRKRSLDEISSSTNEEVDPRTYFPEDISYGAIIQALGRSGDFAPLAWPELEAIRIILNDPRGYGLARSSEQAGMARDLLAIATNARLDYDELSIGNIRFQSKKRSKKRHGDLDKKKKAISLDIFANSGSDSELSEEEDDPELRFGNYPYSMVGVFNRSHVPQLEDITFKYAVGLPHSDTYLILLKDGSLVPRRINQNFNVKGHRRSMGELEKRIQVQIQARDELLNKIEGKKAEIKKATSSKKENVKALVSQLEDLEDELHSLMSEKLRPLPESVVFGSSIHPTEKDLEASEEAAKERNRILRKLVKSTDVSLLQDLARAPVVKGVSLTRHGETETHAEQSLLNTEAWVHLMDQLLQAIEGNLEKPENIKEESFTRIHLVLNRSTCIGCARQLAAELIRFWQLAAGLLGFDTWREAQFTLQQYVHFEITTSSMYERADEKKSNYQNFNRIILGLRDAGWVVRISKGLSTGKESDETNEEVRKRVEDLYSIPRFFVPDWNTATLSFPVPKEISEALMESDHLVIVNGILYEVEDGSAVNPALKEGKELTEKEVGKMAFLVNDAIDEEANEEVSKEWSVKDLKKKTREKMATRSEVALQFLTERGFEVQNVDGQGMNCLIRAMLVAAGRPVNELVVAIIRQHLIQQGVTQENQMLDLLDVAGIILLTFMQAQGLLPFGAGVIVYYPGGFYGGLANTAEPQNNIYLWLSNRHFRALLPPENYSGP